MHGRDRCRALFSGGLSRRRGGWRKAIEEGAGFGEEGAAGVGGDDFIQDLAGGFGAIFLDLNPGEAHRGSGAKRIGGLGGHDTEVKVLGEGAISAGGELVGLGQAGGGG